VRICPEVIDGPSQTPLRATEGVLKNLLADIEALASDDGQELEFVVALGAWVTTRAR
jgi:hypothetical protein